jgi:hypothetical protein
MGAEPAVWRSVPPIKVRSTTHPHPRMFAPGHMRSLVGRTDRNIAAQSCKPLRAPGGPVTDFWILNFGFWFSVLFRF